jgi:general secretion pathway protein C
LSQVDRYPGRYLPRAAGLALAALIASQCANLYGVIATPIDSGPEAAARRPELRPAMLLGSFDPFFTAPASAPVAATDLRLHGLRQDGRTGGGSAIVSQSGGAQRSFGVGEEIAPGIVLKQIGADHVVIARNGMDEPLALAAFEPAGSAAAGPAPSLNATFAGSAAPEARPRRPEARPSLPARSVDFADPSTIPASLMAAPAVPGRSGTEKR